MIENLRNSAFIIDFFEILNKEKIRYIHFKSNQHLNESINGKTDFDILVDKNHTRELKNNLLKYGFKRLNSQKWASYPAVEDWLAYDEEVGTLFHIHLHYQIITGKRFVKEFTFPICKELIDNCVVDSRYNIKISNPSHELFLLLLRITLKLSVKQKARISKLPNSLVDEYNYLIEDYNSKLFLDIARRILTEKNASILNKIVYEKNRLNINLIMKIRRILCRDLRTYRRVSFSKFSLMYFDRSIKWVFSRLKSKVNLQGKIGKTISSGGLSIAFIGSDGSGKTTITSIINKWLSWKIDTAYFYLGTGDESTGLIKYLKKIWSLFRKTKIISDDKAKNLNSLNSKGKIFNLFKYYFALSVAKKRMKTLKSIYKFKSNGRIAIVDRVPQTTINMINDGPLLVTNGSKISTKMKDYEARYFSKFRQLQPDIIFKLLVDGEIAHSRKPSENKNLVIEKANSIKTIDFENSKIIEIDANKPLDDVIKNVKKEIWKAL